MAARRAGWRARTANASSSRNNGPIPARPLHQGVRSTRSDGRTVLSLPKKLTSAPARRAAACRNEGDKDAHAALARLWRKEILAKMGGVSRARRVHEAVDGVLASRSCKSSPLPKRRQPARLTRSNPIKPLVGGANAVYHSVPAPFRFFARASAGHSRSLVLFAVRRRQRTAAARAVSVA